MYIIFYVNWFFIPRVGWSVFEMTWAFGRHRITSPEGFVGHSWVKEAFSNFSQPPRRILVGLQDVVCGKLDLKQLESIEKVVGNKLIKCVSIIEIFCLWPQRFGTLRCLLLTTKSLKSSMFQKDWENIAWFIQGSTIR